MLTQFEKPQVDNNLNQNNSNSGIAMDTEESNAGKVFDGDSGIENMETDEASAPIELDRAELDAIEEKSKFKEIETCISRILDAFWHDDCAGQIIVPETASCYKDFQDENGKYDFENLSFQIITEIVMQYFDCKRIDYKIMSDHNYTSTPIRISNFNQLNSSSSLNQMELDRNCPGPMLKPHNLPNHGACSYLIQAYARCCVEQSRYSSPKMVKKFGNAIVSAIYPIKVQIVRTVILILNGTLFYRTTAAKTHRSILLDLFYANSVPCDFVRHLIEETYKDQRNMLKIFGTLLNNLFTDMQAKMVGKRIDVAPIAILCLLLSITVNSHPDGIVRPICNIVSKIYNFYPTLCTESPGREIAKVSYLGPFLSISVFSEENSKLFEEEDDEMKTTLGIGYQSVSIGFYFS